MEHIKSVTDFLSETKSTKIFSDVLLRNGDVNGVNFHAHRCVLSLFKSLRTALSDDQGFHICHNYNNDVEVILRDVSELSVSLILELLYTGRVVCLSRVEVEQVLADLQSLDFEWLPSLTVEAVVPSEHTERPDACRVRLNHVASDLERYRRSSGHSPTLSHGDRKTIFDGSHRVNGRRSVNGGDGRGIANSEWWSGDSDGDSNDRSNEWPSGNGGGDSIDCDGERRLVDGDSSVNSGQRSVNFSGVGGYGTARGRYELGSVKRSLVSTKSENNGVKRSLVSTKSENSNIDPLAGCHLAFNPKNEHTENKMFSKCKRELKNEMNLVSGIEAKKRGLHIVIHDESGAEIGYRKAMSKEKLSALRAPFVDPSRPKFCVKCQREFARTVNLSRHVLHHLKIRTLACLRCAKEFTTKGNLIEHFIAVHTDEKPFLCDLCSTPFSSALKMKMHIRTVHQIKVCPHCKQSFQDSRIYRSHLNEHLFSSKCSPPIAPRETEHLTVVKSSVTGEEIGYQRPPMSEEEFSQRTAKYVDDSRPGFCRVCNKSMKFVYNFRVHLQGHLGRKDILCKFCPMEFYKVRNLQIHCSQHLHSEKSYSCKHCAEKFSKCDLLRAHVLWDHDAVRGCEQCSVSFNRRYKLCKHITRCRADVVCRQCGFECWLAMYMKKQVTAANESTMQLTKFDMFSQRSSLPDDEHLKHNKVPSNPIESDEEMEVESFHNDQQQQRRDSKSDAEGPESVAVYSHKCYICSHQFRSLNDLEAHLRCHVVPSLQLGGDSGEDVLTPVTVGNSRLHIGYQKKAATKQEFQEMARSYVSDSIPNYCTKCDRVFNNTHFKIHLRGHLGIRDFMCRLCPNRYILLHDLKQHFMVVHQNLSFQCSHCPVSFKTVALLRSHVLWQHEQLRECANGKESFPSRKFLHLHLTRCNTFHKCSVCQTRCWVQKERRFKAERKHQCHLCGQVFKLKSKYDLHQLVHAGKAPLLKCGYSGCKKGYYDVDKLATHQQHKGHGLNVSVGVVGETVADNSTPENNHIAREMRGKEDIGSESQPPVTVLLSSGSRKCFPCDQCDFQFADIQQLKIHLLWEHHEMQSCEKCAVSFSSAADLLSHIGECKFNFLACRKCASRFQTAAELGAHRSALHKRDAADTLQCAFCARTFRFLSKLEWHVTEHTGEKPYRCRTCAARFRSQSTYDRHEMLHFSGERPFLCSRCSKGFKSKSDLIRHTWLHQGLKQFQCAHCQMKFTLKGSLTKHMPHCTRRHAFVTE